MEQDMGPDESREVLQYETPRKTPVRVLRRRAGKVGFGFTALVAFSSFISYTAGAAPAAAGQVSYMFREVSLGLIWSVPFLGLLSLALYLSGWGVGETPPRNRKPDQSN